MLIDQTQKTAIEHHRGPMLVLAGPGSGKTLVITRRTKWLIEEADVHPGKILVVTFTRAAAKEMRERFDRLMNGRHLPVSFGTFHAIFFTVLKYACHYTVESILTEEEKVDILRDLLIQADVELQDARDMISNIAGEISQVKGDLVELQYFYPTSCAKETFDEIYKAYEQKLRRLRKIDYDDMLIQTYSLFKRNPEVLKVWQQKYQYILIDEFQDINRIQYEIIRMMTKPEDNLFVVGDDDQSIYRFRGARPEILLGFTKDYPDAKTVILDKNYRSTGNIVKRAGALIRNNQDRYAKDIQAFRSEGNEVTVKAFKKPVEQNLKIIRELVDLHEQEGRSWQEMAVIFRTNGQMAGMIEQMMTYNVPFVLKDSPPNIYRHWIAQDIFAYMRIAFGENRREDYLRIINRPNRFVSRNCIDTDPVIFQNIADFYEDKEWMLERLEQFQYDVYMLSSMGPYAAIRYIRSAIGYDDYLKEYAASKRISLDDLMNIMDELTEHSHAYETWESWFQAINTYSEKLKLLYRAKTDQGDGVRLLTMHGSKGLEYDTVFIPDANDGIVPHKKAMTDAEKEEERRMFYVAMTRAKNDLRIYFTRQRFGKNAEMSPYVREFLDF